MTSPTDKAAYLGYLALLHGCRGAGGELRVLQDTHVKAGVATALAVQRTDDSHASALCNQLGETTEIQA